MIHAVKANNQPPFTHAPRVDVVLISADLEEGFKIARYVHEASSVHCKVVDPEFHLSLFEDPPQMIFDQLADDTFVKTFGSKRCVSVKIGLKNLEGALTVKEKAVAISTRITEYRKHLHRKSPEATYPRC